ncbi:MAG: DUF2339 domain-containing protein [Thermodesulfovibrionales bacterium]
MENTSENMLPELLKRLEALEADMVLIKKVLAVSRTHPHMVPEPVKPAAPAAQRVAAPQSPLPKGSLESAIGTRWIGRIGMLAVIFGVAFFLKYSFDNRLIGETGRIILGLVAGTGFIAGGEFFQRRKGWTLYGQILTGGGLAILYFSIYAAFAFYHLIPQGLAFGALIAITTTGIPLAVRYSALSVVAIGILGGFLTPVMLSTGENRPYSLFSYILLLDAGILTAAWFRKWPSLTIASLAGTASIYIGWHVRFYTPDQQALAFGIVTVFFILYTLWIFLKKEAGLSGMVIVLSCASGYLLAVYAQNQYRNDWVLKSFILGLTFAEVAMADLSRRFRAAEKVLTQSFLGVSFVCNVIALFILFDKGWLSAALAAEMVAAAFIGTRLRNVHLRTVAYILAVFSAGRFVEELMLHAGPFERILPVINDRFLTCGLIIAGFYLLLFILNRDRETLSRNELPLIPVSLVMTQLLSIVLLSAEVMDFFRLSSSAPLLEIRYARELSLSILWTVYASVVIGAGILKKTRLLRVMGILLASAAIIKVFLFDLSALQTIYRIVSFIMLGMILLAVSYFYNRFRDRIFGDDDHAK